MERGTIIRFSGCRLDGALRRLTLEASGDMIPLGSRAFSVLLHLASRPGVLVPKAELMQAGWPDVTVEENSLSQCISSIRKALGPAASHIVTEAGRGYRFVAAVEETRARGREAWRTTDNPEAYRLFLSAWAAMTSPGVESMWLSIERLEKAVSLDPGFALAHAHLGTSYACLGSFGYVRPRDILPKARAPVLRALEIDPLLPEAHAELGHQQLTLELKFREAEATLLRALELDPDSLAALGTYGGLAAALGRYDEAMACFLKARQVEPLAPNANMGVGTVHYHAGRYREAIAELEASLELNPDFALAQAFIGRCHMRLGNYNEAIARFEACKHRTAGSATDLASVYALSGRTEEARAALAKLKAESNSRYVSAFEIAMIHAALGDREETLGWLEQAVEDAASLTCFMKADPGFAFLRDEPRFMALLEKMGAV